ncbi:MAG: glycosyltransferase family 9 protein, partial [Candidatus Omnitrophica bacterium]|nr:glycosyltransferase family 9 protein [Candidatus Omnitrophota bacterium]
EYNLDLVRLIGAEADDKSLCISTDDSLTGRFLKEHGVTADSDPVALHAWTSDPLKQWPKERFLGLAKLICAEKNIKLILIGGRDFKEESEKLFSSLGNSIIDLTGKTSLKQLAALLKRCKLLVSADSGPVHLACCVGTPVIAIFRNDLPGKTPKRWGPYGRGAVVIERGDLSDISVDEVFAKVKERLKEAI